ncbi:MAG: acetyl-CoA carboxylase biotin carboxylase subunit [Deltaproteobacteria bacterium]
MQKPLRKVLIANRGEIAVRVIRTCRELGLGTVAVYSDADRPALHVRMADEAFRLGPAPSRDSYLRGETVIEVAKRAGADAIHPGYGFLSENAEFAQSCADSGIVFVGPPPAAMDAMGEKTRARDRMRAANVPVVPGSPGPIADEAEAERLAAQMGYPVMLKAAAGGGGKGMRRVDRAEDFPSAWRGARGEAKSAFGDDRVYLEKYLDQPRHVEIQLFADQAGKTIYLGERECSVQRRHQKVIEETPSPILDPEMRRKMGEVAVRAAQAVGYVGAGTVEFLVDARRNFYFLEMNTRLQVEHPVTEWVNGIDLVQWQLEVAAGRPLPWSQEDVHPRGHAIEARVYAEDPGKNFMPSPGRIDQLRVPAGPFVRDDGGVYPGYTVPIHYDPMISKLSIWAEDRPRAIARLHRALGEYVVRGITTNLRYLRKILEHEDFKSGNYDTDFLGRRAAELRVSPNPALEEIALLAAAAFAFRRDEVRAAEMAGQRTPDQAAWRAAGRRAAMTRGSWQR